MYSRFRQISSIAMTVVIVIIICNFTGLEPRTFVLGA